ncbi:MAG: hypothetical protein JSW11_20915 [Candidatus Heimdallarchaeota archaeon]|nr:MAG: hypothetical protein JSW11_20915 [Candidatus Heimdallarchaeota archaeon]
MRKRPLGLTKSPLGRLKSLIVISDWISFSEIARPADSTWLYKGQTIQSINNASVIFIPVDFSRLIYNTSSYILLYGAGIYWTKFSVYKQTITTDTRYISGLVIPEEKWLDNHFNTEPFVFPPPYDFMIVGDNLQEFSFNALRTEEESTGYVRRAFGRGIILAQLVFPFKEPLVMLRKTTESYEEFDSPTAPMRVLISEFAEGKVVNEISLESPNKKYEESTPGIRKIQPNLLKIFPEKWSNEIYLNGLRREISIISKDFAFIGAPLILK